jgi:hypothetical protein
MPKPTEPTPELIREIADRIRGCGMPELAAACVVPERQFRQWMRRGEVQEAGPHRDLFDAVNAAVRDHNDDLLNATRAWIAKGGRKGKQAARCLPRMLQILRDAGAPFTPHPSDPE